MKTKLLIGTLLIFGTFFSSAEASYKIDATCNDVSTPHLISGDGIGIDTQYCGNPDYVIRTNTMITGNGQTVQMKFYNTGSFVTNFNFTTYDWVDDNAVPPEEESTFPASATAGMIEDFQRILYENLNLILLFTSAIMVWILLKKWIFGGTKRI